MVVLLSTDKMWVTQNMWIISGKSGGSFEMSMTTLNYNLSFAKQALDGMMEYEDA